jgi:hypothetical protein
MLRAGVWWLSVVADVPARMRADENHSGEVAFNLVDSFARVSRVDSGHAAAMEETVFVAAKVGITPVVSAGYQEAPAETPQTGGDCGKDDVHSLFLSPAETPQTGGDCGQAQIKRGSYRDKSNKRLEARRLARAARQRREALHLWTTQLARRFAALKITSPPLVDATKSGRGDKYEHGAEVALKAALNRRVLDQAPGLAIAMLQYKIAERGGVTEKIVAAGPVMAGNEIVEARKATRKLKRAANAR